MTSLDSRENCFSDDCFYSAENMKIIYLAGISSTHNQQTDKAAIRDKIVLQHLHMEDHFKALSVSSHHETMIRWVISAI